MADPQNSISHAFFLLTFPLSSLPRASSRGPRFKMYDLFITGFLNDVDFEMAKAILSGYCWGQPVHRLYRIVYFGANNPNQPKPIMKRNNIKGIPPSPDPSSFGLPNFEPVHNPAIPYVDPEWAQLSDILKKYVTGHLTSTYQSFDETDTKSQAIIHHHGPL